MKAVCKVILLAMVALTLACAGASPELKNVDLNLWKADHMGCEGHRQEFEQPLLDQKDQLLGLSEMEIVSVLGKPDVNELYKRNQKFYFYFLEPGGTCENALPSARKLSIRFNAMGLAKEIAVE